MLWGFYFSAFCMIRSELGATELTNLLFLFMWVLLAIILVILLIQLEQMVGEGMRYSLVMYLAAIGLVVSSFSQSSVIIRMGSFILAGAAVGMAWIKQSIGLEQATVRLYSAWQEWKTAREGDGGMEGMESVYK